MDQRERFDLSKRFQRKKRDSMRGTNDLTLVARSASFHQGITIIHSGRGVVKRRVMDVMGM